MEASHQQLFKSYFTHEWKDGAVRACQGTAICWTPVAFANATAPWIAAATMTVGRPGLAQCRGQNPGRKERLRCQAAASCDTSSYVNQIAAALLAHQLAAVRSCTVRISNKSAAMRMDALSKLHG